MNCPVVGSTCVGVADRDGKKLEELLAGLWAGARDDGWSCERSAETTASVELYLNRDWKEPGGLDRNYVQLQLHLIMRNPLCEPIFLLTIKHNATAGGGFALCNG
jgi:hypothetical protein